MKTGIASYFPTDAHFKIDKIWLQVSQGGNQAVIQRGMTGQPQTIKGGKCPFLLEIHCFERAFKSLPFSGPSEILLNL